MKIKYLDFGAKKQPQRSYFYDAGMDVFLNEDLELQPHETKRIPLGFGLEIPPTYAGFLITRSSVSLKGIIPAQIAIDSGYTGEINFVVTNGSNEVFKAKAGDRVCSLIVTPVMIFDWGSEEKSRSAKGFGSTGK